MLIGIELNSSRKSVPPSAMAKKPSLFSAPVNAPFTVPNKLLSINVSVIAPQLTATKGLFALLEF